VDDWHSLLTEVNATYWDNEAECRRIAKRIVERLPDPKQWAFRVFKSDGNDDEYCWAMEFGGRKKASLHHDLVVA
jgi:hypothetical protein